MSVCILEDVHKLIFDLRPSLLDDLGLVAALQWYAESRLESQGIAVMIETTGEEQRLPAQIETALFRVVQEALNNVARHAEAKNAEVQSYARVKRFALVPAEFTEATGEVTPTQKVKRQAVAARYAALLDSLYE